MRKRDAGNFASGAVEWFRGGGCLRGRWMDGGWGCKAFSAGDEKVSRHCGNMNETAGELARRFVGNKYGNGRSGAEAGMVGCSYVCELVLNDVSPWEFDLVRDFVRPGDD